MNIWDQFVDELESLGHTAAEWLPKIIVAILVLIIGRWILRAARALVERLLGVEPVQAVFERAGLTQALAPSGMTPNRVLGMVTYAFLLVALWLIVFRILELPDLVDLLERLLAWIPIVVLAGAIVIISAAVANFVSGLLAPYSRDHGIPWLATVVRVAIIVFGGLFALDVLDVTFAEDLVKIVVAAIGVALAVSFGVGGIDTAKKWWERYASPRDMSNR